MIQLFKLNLVRKCFAFLYFICIFLVSISSSFIVGWVEFERFQLLITSNYITNFRSQFPIIYRHRNDQLTRHTHTHTNARKGKMKERWEKKKNTRHAKWWNKNTSSGETEKKINTHYVYTRYTLSSVYYWCWLDIIILYIWILSISIMCMWPKSTVFYFSFYFKNL